MYCDFIVYFIVFVYTVSSSIQANKLIKRVFNESTKFIDDAISFIKDKEHIQHSSVDKYTFKIDLISEKRGYLDLINFDRMYNLIKEYDYKVYIDSNIGDYLIESHKIAVCYSHEQIKVNFIDKLVDCITLSDDRASYNDYVFSLQKIIEIALRAIYSGINDP